MNSAPSKKSESGTILPILVIVILIIGIAVGTNLIKIPQIFKSRASGVEDGKYITINGVKSLAEMRAELKNAGWASDLINRESGEHILQLFNRNRNNIGGNSFNCVVNSGDLNNMPTDLETPFVGEEVPITIVMKLEQKACNTWFVNPRITNMTTGKQYGDWHPVGIGDSTSPHACRNGRNPFIQPAGSAHFEYEGAGRFDQDDGNTHPQSADGTNWSAAGDAPLSQASTCFFGLDTPGHYKAEIALGARQDSNGACNLPPDANHQGVGLYYSCEFDVVAQKGQTSSGGGAPGTSPVPGTAGPNNGTPGSNNYTVYGHVKNPSGAGVSGVSVEVWNGLNAHVSLQTDSNGVFTTNDFIKRNSGAGNDFYAVRIPDGKGKTVGGDYTWVSSSTPHDTVSGDNSYEFQLAGSNDCASVGFNGQSGRCDFTYSPTLQTSTPPTSDLNGPSSGIRNQVLTFTATPVIGSGKTLSNASIFIAKDVRDYYPERVSDATAQSVRSNPAMSDAQKGFNCPTASSLNCAWLRIGYTTSGRSFTGSFTPDQPGVYTIITQVEDSSFRPNQPDNQDAKYGLCSSNPYPFVHYPYLTGYGIFNNCNSSIKVQVTQPICTTGQSPSVNGCVLP